MLAAVEQLQADLAVERYGDPHVAFVVMVYPDRHPSIISLTPQGASDFANLVLCDGEDSADGEPERFFSAADLFDASHALDVAESFYRYGHRVLPKQPFGKGLVEDVERKWVQRRETALGVAMQAAAVAAWPRCIVCGSRYQTARGLKAHQRLSSWCGPRVQPYEEARALFALLTGGLH